MIWFTVGSGRSVWALLPGGDLSAGSRKVSVLTEQSWQDGGDISLSSEVCPLLSSALTTQTSLQSSLLISLDPYRPCSTDAAIRSRPHLPSKDAGAIVFIPRAAINYRISKDLFMCKSSSNRKKIVIGEIICHENQWYHIYAGWFSL